MEKAREKITKGISLRRMSVILGAVFLVVSVLLLVFTILTMGQFRLTEKNARDYIIWQQNTGLLQAGSDELTYDARAFSVTGDKRYVEAYFKEVNETRRRDKALETVKEAVSDSGVHMHLDNAMQTSVTLMNIEYYSMRLVIDAMNYNITEFPDVLQAIELDPEDELLSPGEKMQLAENMVIDESYHWYKNLIEDELKQCVNLLAESTEVTISDSFETLRFLFILQVIMIFVILIIIALLIMVIWSQVIRPMIQAVDEMTGRKFLTPHGAKEFILLVNAYNKMFEDQRSQRDMLKFEATHDVMTGLINRAGFYNICAESDLSTTAIIMIDIDDFKNINDKHGHDVGDKALVHVANELKKNFRSDDKICRLGGDEFVVVMNGVEDTEGFRRIIAEKVVKVNNGLLNGGSENPDLSISCGVAFGTAEDTTESIMKKADKQLYYVKNNGKQNVAFA